MRGISPFGRQLSPALPIAEVLVEVWRARPKRARNRSQQLLALESSRSSFQSTARLIVFSLFMSCPSPALSQVLGVHAGSYDNAGYVSSIDVSDGSYTLLDQIHTGGVSGLATDGETWYATLAKGAATLVTLDPISGQIIATIGAVKGESGNPCKIGDLAMGGDGVLYGISVGEASFPCDGPGSPDGLNRGGTILVIDTNTAVATAIGRPMDALSSTNNVHGSLAVDGEGRLWLSPSHNHPEPGHLYIIDKNTGLIESNLQLSGLPDSVLADDAYPTGFQGFTWNPGDGLLYASFWPWVDEAIERSLWCIDPATGATKMISDSTGVFHDLAFGSDTAGSEACASINDGLDSDSDGDGVNDDADQCPNSIETEVDETGCPIRPQIPVPVMPWPVLLLLAGFIGLVSVRTFKG